MARIVVLDTKQKRMKMLQETFKSTHELQRASDLSAVGEHVAVAVVVIREPLQVYLNTILRLQSRPKCPKLLAVFESGNLPADYTLVAAQACGADAILYAQYSDIELVNQILSLLETN